MRPYVSTKNEPKNGHICSRLNIFIASYVWPGVIFIQQHNKTEVEKKVILSKMTLSNATKYTDLQKSYIQNNICTQHSF